MMTANLNFIVLKINDIDVGQLPQKQQQTALNLLLNEETENIVLQLKRKINKSISESDDIEVRSKICYLKIQHHTTDCSLESSAPSVNGSPEIVMNLHLPSSSTLQEYCMAKATQTDDIAFYVHEHLRNIQKNTEQEHNLFEQSLAPEIDIEEITLRKSDSNERLGLTVCYSNGGECAEEGGVDNVIDCETYSDATVAEVYISDIHPDSVAGRDGRLRQGDQILQINGKDIKTRSETETLMAENNNAVTLLVSRYLYADEDDFNDPSTIEDDDVVLVMEDDDDDDDDEFYDENNLTYVNCMINNDCFISATDKLDKELGRDWMSQIEQQQEHLQQTSKKSEEKSYLNTVVSTALTNAAYQDNVLKITGDSKKKNEKISKNEKKASLLNASPMVGTYLQNGADRKSTTISSDGNENKNYESEHIYETIPEDPESEPFYCSPYDSSVYVTAIASCSSSTVTDALQKLQQKQRVAQWLGIKPSQSLCATTSPRQTSRSSNGCVRSVAHRHKSTGTVRSAVTTLTNGSIDFSATPLALPVNSHLDDQDNSSSAYNTGGSNNSVSPLTLMLNPKNRSDYSFACTAVIPTSNGTTEDLLGIQPPNQKTSNHQKSNSPKEKCKITSPKGGSFQFVKTTNSGGANKLAIMDPNLCEKNINANKDSNIHRNMLLRQHLVNQTLSIEKTMHPNPLHQTQQNYYQQQADQIQCPQFTAPNLSQYHFVSSQEVNNLSLINKVPKSSTTVAATITNNTKNEEEAMVWKVKRRPDGTRYIVRRPAKNRVIKERNTRLSVERIRNDITTTEDDTISEIKTGRYWTREERKKHIERAKERRQQQQNKSHLPYDDSATPTLCIGDVTTKNSHDREREKINQQKLNIIRQQHKTVHPVHQQHYQLQFNSVDGQKLSSSLNPHNVESPTSKSPSMLPLTSEEVSIITGNLVPQEAVNSTTTVFTSSEHNQINNALISVTTA